MIDDADMFPPDGSWFDGLDGGAEVVQLNGRRASNANNKRQPKQPTRPAPSHAFDRGDHVELAGALADRLRDRGEIVYDDGALYRYDDARHIFAPVSEAEQSVILMSFAGTPAGEKQKPLSIKRADVQGSMRLAWDAATQPDFFASARPGIAFSDVFVEVTADAIVKHPHSPEHRARFSYPFAFVAEAWPTRFLQYLVDVFKDDPDQEDKIALVQEFVGISLLGLAPRFQRCLTLLGKGSNGKSVLMTVVGAAAPKDACCAIPPQEWGQEYRAALLAGKRLNIVSELPAAEILASEAFKGVVTGDPITGRHIRQAPFTFSPVAGHIFSANALPGVLDQSHGFWRRHLVVEFNRLFVEGGQGEARADVNLPRTLVTDELASIVSWFLSGAQRLLQRGAYVVPTSSVAAVERWKQHADQVRAFIDECTEELPPSADPRLWVRGAALYKSYRSWAERNGHSRLLAHNTFGTRMELLGKGGVRDESGARYPVRLSVSG
jgi:putative DNA primase/helicase